MTDTAADQRRQRGRARAALGTGASGSPGGDRDRSQGHAVTRQNEVVPTLADASSQLISQVS